MTKIKALKELENQAETLQKALEEFRAMIAAEETTPKPIPIGAPLREAPEIGADMWVLSHNFEVYQVEWHGGPTDMAWLASGSVFATPEDAEFTAKKRAIFAHPIGEWMPNKKAWRWNWQYRLIGTTFSASDCPDAYRIWLNGELAFDDDGKAELERRVAAWKALCKEYGKPMNTTELKAAESALETALDQVRQLIASDAEQKPKPEPVRGPLTAAPEIGSVYWCVSSEGRTFADTWTDHVIDRARLARGCIFASERDAEYKAAFDAIWGHPIGEWHPEYRPWVVGLYGNIQLMDGKAAHYALAYMSWRKGKIGFGDAGQVKLERRVAEQKKLDERFGL